MEEFYPEIPKYALDDLVLPESVKDRLLDVVEYAHHSDVVFKSWGLDKTHRNLKRMGINLYGPPGTGKTMAAHAIAQYLGRTIIVVNYADIESKYVGETPKNLRRAFEVAQETNSILFFDEADAILSKRVTSMNSASDVSVNQTRSVMLMLLNDCQDYIIFATNFIENFDPAFMRRISAHVKIELPDLACRERLWRMYIPETMPTDADVKQLAAAYEGISGSDIATAVLKAAFSAARHSETNVSQTYFEQAIEDIIRSKQENEAKDASKDSTHTDCKCTPCQCE